MREQLLDHIRVDRVVDPGTHLDVARIETLLPRVGGRDHSVGADQLAPVHVVAESRGQQSQAVPALAGILTIMFWARRLNAMAFSTIAAASRYRRGSVWMESRPSRPPCAAKAGSSSFAAATDISSTSFHPTWSSVAVGSSVRSD